MTDLRSPSSDDATTWVVRAGRQGEAEQSNLALGRASIGWGELSDLSDVVQREQLKEIIDDILPDAGSRSRAASVGQIWAFRALIRPGDTVVMPLKTEPGLIAIGRCTGTYAYDAEAPEYARHILPVAWQPQRIRRDALRLDLQGIIAGALTVYRAQNRGAAARLARVASGGTDPGWDGDESNAVGAGIRGAGHYQPILEAALQSLEAGLWTTYGELAEVAGTNAQTVGNFMNRTTVEGAHRVMGKDGRPVAGFVWSDGRQGTQRDALQAEDVEFDPSGAASEAQHVRAGDLRAFLEEKGVLSPLPRRAWLVRGSSVDGHDLIPAWRQHGFTSLRASKLREVEPGIDRGELKSIVNDDYSQSSYAAKAAKVDEFHAFLSRMKVDDVIVTTSQGRLYLGTVTGPAEYVASADSLSNLRRAVEWAPDGIDYAELPGDVKARLQIQYDVVEMTQQLETLERLLTAQAMTGTSDTAPDATELTLPDATDDLAQTLHVDREWLQECVDLLRDRPQLIFYGPPGTGKTYIAQHLARHLAGDNVRLVQFHPGYSYEDFFEGYRPLEEGGFKLKPGPLRKVVDAARENKSTPYVLIIDEINRGNLAKIFGELYFLLEYRDENVDLLYATDDDSGFTLPPNVFVIGTMNTADRSIALVDAAMRRRFAFVPLHPSESPTDDVLRRWLAAEGHDLTAADLLDELNRRIEDPDFKIGPSYFMRSAVHAPGGLERAWRTAILPLLEEHHYGDGLDVSKHYGLDTIRARVAPVQPGTPGESPTDPA